MCLLSPKRLPVRKCGERYGAYSPPFQPILRNNTELSTDSHVVVETIAKAFKLSSGSGL